MGVLYNIYSPIEKPEYNNFIDDEDKEDNNKQPIINNNDQVIVENIEQPIIEKKTATQIKIDNANIKRIQKAQIKINLQNDVIKLELQKKRNEFFNKVVRLSNQYDKIDYTKVRGSFDYTNTKKKQDYEVNILNINDAVLICTLLVNLNKINEQLLPAGYLHVYRLLKSAGGQYNNSDFAYLFKNDLIKWVSPIIIDAKRKYKNNPAIEAKIENPKTGNFIKKNGVLYKKLFGSIKLKSFRYSPLHNFNMIDYEVKDYCVPSYLSQLLQKKEYNLISSQLQFNNTPTYLELTEMMNKIKYNLNVYITDKEQIQEQKTYTKNLNILIHNEHMYVLNNKTINVKITETKTVDHDEFKSIESEVYTNISKINKGVKYVLENRFAEINKELQLKNAYSQVNINFYNQCEIAPVRYINDKIKLVEGIDINKCYFNILKNKNYRFAVQTGSEITEVYNKDDIILQHGFYYVIFHKFDDIDRALFMKKCWIYGDVILNLNLQNKITIKFKHIPGSLSCRTLKEDTEFKYLDVIHYTGSLCNYDTVKSKIYQCKSIEANAYKSKFDLNKFDYSINIDKNIIVREKFLNKTTGIYSYLSILQYARMQLYQLYNEIIKINPDVNIKKIYTDSITFDKKIRTKNEKVEIIDGDILPIKLNKLLKTKYNFTVKYETSDFTWNHHDIVLEEPEIDNKKIINYTDINQLLEKNMSFCMNAKAGYGKTHLIKNIIIPYLQLNNKKFIISSSSKESADKLKTDLVNINCDVIHQLLCTKVAHLDKIKEDLKDINYIIIDECSLLDTNILNLLQYCKLELPNLRFILSGDKNQCDFNENANNSFMDTYYFKFIVDFNFLTIDWHLNARYNQSYDNFLNGLLKYISGGSDPNCIKYVCKYFNTNYKNSIKQISENNLDKNTIKLSYTNKTRISLIDESTKAMTVHKSQGKTINIPYSIYEIDRMSIKVLYTGLSRCSDPKLITIYY